MTQEQFYKDVEKMRFWQKKYFKDRDKQSLEIAKKTEKIIDEEIKRVNKVLEDRKQPKLF